MEDPKQKLSQEYRRLPEHSWVGERSVLQAGKRQRAQIPETIEKDLGMLEKNPGSLKS